MAMIWAVVVQLPKLGKAFPDLFWGWRRVFGWNGKVSGLAVEGRGDWVLVFWGLGLDVHGCLSPRHGFSVCGFG